jgi:hypothetical protein
MSQPETQPAPDPGNTPIEELVEPLSEEDQELVLQYLDDLAEQDFPEDF